MQHRFCRRRCVRGWPLRQVRRYVGDADDVIGVNHFGASAPGSGVMREYGFTVEHVCQRAIASRSKKG